MAQIYRLNRFVTTGNLYWRAIRLSYLTGSNQVLENTAFARSRFSKTSRAADTCAAYNDNFGD